MEELILRYQQLVKAYSRLDYMTKKFVQLSQKEKSDYLLKDDENELIVHRDALIKRFEFCYDLTWKFYKLVLKEKYSINVTSPRKVFQEAYQQGIFTTEETEKFIEMIDARNETTHIYDEAVAESISQKILIYYTFLAQMIKKWSPEKLSYE